MSLAGTVIRVLCPSCFGQNPRCVRCLGQQYIQKHAYADGGGELGDDFSDVSVSESTATCRRAEATPPSRHVRHLSEYEGEGIS